MTFLTAWIPLTRQVRVRPGLERARARGGGRRRHGRDPGGARSAARGSSRRPARRRSASSRASSAPSGRSYRTSEFGERRTGIDVVVDPVGGAGVRRLPQALAPLGAAIAIGFAGGIWEPVDPARLVGRNVGVQGFYLGRLMALRADLVARGDRASWSSSGGEALCGRSSAPSSRSTEAAEAQRPRRGAAARPARSCLFPETALVTGGARRDRRAIVGAAARRDGMRGARCSTSRRLRRARPGGVGRTSARSTSPA